MIQQTITYTDYDGNERNEERRFKMKKGPDIAEFFEDLFDIKLLDCQKDVLRKAYEAGPDVKLVFPRWNGRTHFMSVMDMIKYIPMRE